MAEWFPARVAAAQPVGSELVHLEVEVGTEVASSFHTPGQYHRVRMGELWNPYALASAPHQPRFQYLVRRAPGLAELLTARSPGDWLEVSTVEGPGFPVERARGRNLLLVGTGTASAPLRSVLEAVVAERDGFGTVTALLGHHAPDQVPFLADLPRWADHRVLVHHTVSTPTPAWAGPVGHVQAHLDLLRLHAPGAVAFLCGQKNMVADVTAGLVDRGVNATDVFLNLP